ncbi:transcriptional regulator [Cupriavidus necator N-1]|uniref:Transcriptional regulator n=1 Tax=Cupriavidus necator (strain ATCC 43291 / DSM 13513 / CCUG 52238 / LMG 8453 / N-1) TaxID=1042878 RepID=F8GM53_CUPNN|nr:MULTISPECIES: Crp/Fnr family transcriptional regulator [Cupriavidus]AEI80072.1 transcriptional regulator [Cupriavidus necator N-1]KAI3599287.1 Transcriptional regulator, Crp/Fnr family [Cupriavidus necator H850]MDX6010294.1 Crp/Fnr family transcriptional regulator [Cupriavidus necator]QUN30299.1 Crp/Fnr family transcriptional regulator [Cupriavidus sp. KK10]
MSEPADPISAPAAVLAGHAWFGALAPEHQALAARETLLQSFAAGAFIARRGEPSRHWIGVDSGLIKLAVYTPDGRGCTFSGVPAGGWCGEGSVIKREDRRYDVIAIRDSQVLLVPEPVFNMLLAQSLPFASFVVRQLNERMGQFIATVQNDRLLGADARVAQAIAQLFHPDLYPRTSPVLELSQEEIGLLTGLSRQRVNQALRRLADAGMVHLSYQSIRVTDLPRLRHFGLSEL